MVRWTFPNLPSHMSGPVHWAHVLLHSCLYHNHRVSVYSTNKMLLELFPLWRGWEKKQHVRDDNVSLVCWYWWLCGDTPLALLDPCFHKIQAVTPFRKQRKHALEETKEKELCFVLQCLYLRSLSWEPQSITKEKLGTQWLAFPRESTSILRWHLSFEVFVYPWCRNEAPRSATAGEET